MKCDWRLETRPSKRTAAAFLPPLMVDETAWDILLALYLDRTYELSLGKLCAMASVPQDIMRRWLAELERRQLINAAEHSLSGELRAVLTPASRVLFDRYLSATIELQLGAHD